MTTATCTVYRCRDDQDARCAPTARAGCSRTGTLGGFDFATLRTRKGGLYCAGFAYNYVSTYENLRGRNVPSAI